MRIGQTFEIKKCQQPILQSNMLNKINLPKK